MTEQERKDAMRVVESLNREIKQVQSEYHSVPCCWCGDCDDCCDREDLLDEWDDLIQERDEVLERFPEVRFWPRKLGG